MSLDKAALAQRFMALEESKQALFLQKLGDKGQVLCVTHQPQVASKGRTHLFVSKHSTKKAVSTRSPPLSFALNGFTAPLFPSNQCGHAP